MNTPNDLTDSQILRLVENGELPPRKLVKEWSAAQDGLFLDAVHHVREQVADGCSLAGAIEHSAALHGIERSALEHEYELRRDEFAKWDAEARERDREQLAAELQANTQ